MGLPSVPGDDEAKGVEQFTHTHITGRWPPPARTGEQGAPPALPGNTIRPRSPLRAAAPYGISSTGTGMMFQVKPDRPSGWV